MNKKKLWIIALVVVPIVLVVFTGGIWVSVGPSFDYDYNAVTIEKGDGFIPRHFHLRYNSSEFPLIPIVLKISKSKLPKTLIINKRDITYLERHLGFPSFRVDLLKITYDNGKSKEFINSTTPIGIRTSETTGEGWNTFSFNDAITEKSSFLYHIEGVSFDVDGKEYPFTYSVKYRYSSLFEITTQYEVWASV
jgi:hypothetical protein